MKVLFVTRDKKPGMIGVRIARELEGQEQVRVAVVAEGMSIEEWEGSGLRLSGGFLKGPLTMDEPFAITPSTVLQQLKPDVVVCGLSSPIRSEAWFAEATRGTGTLYRGIPLVYLDDNWGAVHRCQTPAELVLTIDELGNRLVEQSLLYSRHSHKVEIIGDLSASAASEPIPQAAIEAFYGVKGDAEYAFLLCTQKWPESTEVVDIALVSCAKSLDRGEKLVVIQRVHPGASPELKQRCHDRIIPFAQKYPDAVRILGDAFSTDHLATLANGTFAATGSALRAAAYAGKIPICVWTPALAEKLKAESGMENHPLFIAGAGMQITGGVDVVQLLAKQGERIRKNQGELLQPVPFDAAKAATAIMEMAK